MFYEYPELTPIGRRGDEMIRRLADRLVAVDLLDQASELLQYQVDKRLEGAGAGRGAPRHGLSDQPQARSRHLRASHHAHCRSLGRTAPAAAAIGGTRAKRRRTP